MERKALLDSLSAKFADGVTAEIDDDVRIDVAYAIMQYVSDNSTLLVSNVATVRLADNFIGQQATSLRTMVGIAALDHGWTFEDDEYVLFDETGRDILGDAVLGVVVEREPSGAILVQKPGDADVTIYVTRYWPVGSFVAPNRSVETSA